MFDDHSEEIHIFEKNAGFEKTKKTQLVKWLKNEIKEYEKSSSKKKKANKLMDIIVLVMQISRRDKVSLDEAWNEWWKNSEKYLK